MIIGLSNMHEMGMGTTGSNAHRCCPLSDLLHFLDRKGFPGGVGMGPGLLKSLSL